MSDELRYGIIKYKRKVNTFIIIDKNRTMIYDSRVGFLDLKALSSKDQLESADKNKLIAYMKPLMINVTDFLRLTQEKIKATGFRLISTILGIISPNLFYDL